MDKICINQESIKGPDKKLMLNFLDKINLKRSGMFGALSNLSIYCR